MAKGIFFSPGKETIEVGLHVAIWVGKNNLDFSIVIVPLPGRQPP